PQGGTSRGADGDPGACRGAPEPGARGAGADGAGRGRARGQSPRAVRPDRGSGTRDRRARHPDRCARAPLARRLRPGAYRGGAPPRSGGPRGRHPVIRPTLVTRRDARTTCAILVATMFGAGRAPFAPGTVGTLLAVPLAILAERALPGWGLPAAAAAVSVIGVWASGVTARGLG